ncbi:MAG TPA: hypothetical protein VGT03_11865 [Candidatus Acidoferrales bacterium]|nr:hypothetical protein [Candidatus Acidoferrales bacterium]
MKCSSLFSYYSDHSGQAAVSGPVSRSIPSHAVRVAEPEEAIPEASLFSRVRSAYRVFRWVSLTVLVVVILLILHKSAPPQVPFDPQAAASAESKLANASAAVQHGQPYQLDLNRTELNSFLSANLATSNNPAAQASAASQPATSAVPDPAAATPAQTAAPPEPDPTIADVQSSVRDFKVDLVGDLVKAYVVFNFHGKDLSLELDGHLTTSDGYLQFQPVSGQLGSLPLPQSTLNSAVEKLLSSPENKEKLRLPDGVRDIQIVDGHLVVNYQ